MFSLFIAVEYRHEPASRLREAASWTWARYHACSECWTARTAIRHESRGHGAVARRKTLDST